MGCLGALFTRRSSKANNNTNINSTSPPAANGSVSHPQQAQQLPPPPRRSTSTTRLPLRFKSSPSWKSSPDDVLPACDPVRVLGEGTFGTVVLVRERSTRKLFAVKVMSMSQLVHEAQLDNIVLERQVLRDAGPHPFVVECHSGFQTTEAVVLVLEYLSGGDMYDLMKANGTLTEEAARFYLAETVVGVAELHRHGFVFRDLKLENILLDDRGHVRLTDFGLAGRATTPHWDDRSLVDISGTAIYQAPEILSGAGHGTLVDWWALGVLAYVLLTGRPPFPNHGSREQLYHTIQHQELDLDTDTRLSHVSAECRDFIGKLLQKSPALRLGAGKDARDVKSHPFFKSIDFDALLRFELEPPLAPPRAAPGEKINEKEAEKARGELQKKLSGKHKPANRAVARVVKARGRELDIGEYKPVNVLPAPKTEERRVSIGLDFDARNAEASTKTWTGTTDDFGRKMGQ